MGMTTTHRTQMDTTITSYVNCAALEERDVDWNEIRDAIENDGFSSIEADAAINDYLARTSASADVRETAWALVDILQMSGDPRWAKYQDVLFTLETEWHEQSVWQQVIVELRDITIAKTQS